MGITTGYVLANSAAPVLQMEAFGRFKLITGSI